jgi:hypothetical protein
VSLADDIAEDVGGKYGARAKDKEPGEGAESKDAAALDCAGDVLRAVAAKDRGALVEAMRGLLAELNE